MNVAVDRLLSTLAAMWPSHDGLPALAAALSQTSSVSLVLDSREITGGEIFLAVPGVAVDGRDFMAAALASGAAAILCEAGEMPCSASHDSPVLALPALSQRLAEMGRQLFGVPESLALVGVTGTNGKSSVTHYIATLLEALGSPAGVIGTLGYGRPTQLSAALQTTPGPLPLQQMLGDMAAQGIGHVAMEVSSHALAQSRLGDTRIDAAVFTNLSRDHLDYHGSMAAYAAAKARLFRRDTLELAVVNGDDALARLMLAGLAAGVRVLAVGSDEATTLRVLECETLPSGLRAIVATPEHEGVLELPLMGRFNLDNALLAMATVYGLGFSLTSVWEAAASLRPVPGRMQRLPRATGSRAPIVVVDYAHTPDALENALSALREHLPARDGGKLWCVFGCGGDRDSGKRPLMAAIAERLADAVVVTDDNPRGEPAAAIREQILAGLTPAGRAAARSIAGRQLAIETVIAAASAGDIVLIAGKGHEDYQEIAGTRHPFSDLEIAQACCDRLEIEA